MNNQSKGSMSIAKVIEVLAEGNSIEEAMEDAVAQASKTIDNIKHLYVNDIQAQVENNLITKYRVNTKVTFVLKGED